MIFAELLLQDLQLKVLFIDSIKNYYVKQQDFETAGAYRDLQRKFTASIEELKARLAEIEEQRKPKTETTNIKE